MNISKYGCDFEVTNNPKYINFWKNHFVNNWEIDTFQFLSRNLNSEKTFIDIGSWIGPIAIPAALCSKNVICFEPDLIAFNELYDNCKLNNLKNVELEKLAVSIHKKISLGAEELGESMTRDSNSENTFDTNCISVKEIFEKYKLNESMISAIKIDIEGHEAELLKDEFLMKLNVPMHISLHFPFVNDKNSFYNTLKTFLDSKNLDIRLYNLNNFTSIEIE